MHCVCISLGKYLVHGMHDAMPDVAALTLGALSKAIEIVDKDIDMCDQPQKDLQRGMVSWLWQWLWSG